MRIKIDGSVTEVHLLKRLQSAFVAMNTNRSHDRTNVVDVVGLGEEVNRRLAVEKEEV